MYDQSHSGHNTGLSTPPSAAEVAAAVLESDSYGIDNHDFSKELPSKKSDAVFKSQPPSPPQFFDHLKRINANEVVMPVRKQSDRLESGALIISEPSKHLIDGEYRKSAVHTDGKKQNDEHQRMNKIEYSSGRNSEGESKYGDDDRYVDDEATHINQYDYTCPRDLDGDQTSVEDSENERSEDTTRYYETLKNKKAPFQKSALVSESDLGHKKISDNNCNDDFPPQRECNWQKRSNYIVPSLTRSSVERPFSKSDDSQMNSEKCSELSSTIAPRVSLALLLEASTAAAEAEKKAESSRKYSSEYLQRSAHERARTDKYITDAIHRVQTIPRDEGSRELKPMDRRELSLPPSWTRLAEIKKDSNVLSECRRLVRGTQGCGRDCEARFSNLVEFARHVDEKHDLNFRPYLCPNSKCPWATIGFHERSECTRHIRTKHYKAMYACEFQGCSKVYNRSDAFRRHVRQAHGNTSSRFSRITGQLYPDIEKSN